jgi:adenylate cyclase
MAQRMESVAAAGGVMLSESAARLVEYAAVMGEPEMVRVKGCGDPIVARRLLAMAMEHDVKLRQEPTLVGRRWEMAAVEGILERAIDGRGGVVALTGSAGIGKTRLARETGRLAERRGIEVFSTYCESHASDIAFQVVARLLRAGTGVIGLGSEVARARVREQMSNVDPEDLLLLNDLLGISDPAVALPDIAPDARRRRLTALINSVSLARTTPAVFVVEDVHWIDEVSESILADFLAVIPQTPTVVIVTYRPEYEGALARVSGAQTITLAPLRDSDTEALIGEQLGSDPSVGDLATTIAERASGNPFFAEEIVRDLAERGVLHGQPGAYICQRGPHRRRGAGDVARHHRRTHRSTQPHG